MCWRAGACMMRAVRHCQPRITQRNESTVGQIVHDRTCLTPVYLISCFPCSHTVQAAHAAYVFCAAYQTQSQASDVGTLAICLTPVLHQISCPTLCSCPRCPTHASNQHLPVLPVLTQSQASDVGTLVNVGVICYLKQLLETGFFHAGTLHASFLLYLTAVMKARGVV